MDDEGRLVLPPMVVEALSLRPGVSIQAEVTKGRLEILNDSETITATIEKSGRMVLAPTGESVNVVDAVRATRGAQANRGRRSNG